MAAEDIEQPQVPAMNDPWAPQSPSNVTVLPCPTDPLHQLISSDRYIESLEKKLNRLKGRSRREPSSHDIVQSLSKLRNDQMERFLKEESSQTQAVNLSSGGEATSSSSYIQRRLYPEKQAVTGDELVVLLQDDALAIRIAEEQELEELAAGNGAAAAMVILKTGSKTKEEIVSEPVPMKTDVADAETLSISRKEDCSGASYVDSEQDNSEHKT
ncbi:uncharacterized protein LOC124289787 [Haliotis rubra]|uniref:uncharacterized protein LOC124289787 n=1 Tax=Haliotis rubra TaxID=36100 RepID=UPI001EE54CB4|nr:uncharacterized protein LOC124289787 [Haliotis rubra]